MEYSESTLVKDEKNSIDISEKRSVFYSKSYVIIISSLLLILALTISLAILLNSRKSVEEDQANHIPIQSSADIPQNIYLLEPLRKGSHYIIKDTSIVEVRDNEEKVLFTNAAKVTSVRLGPDGNTLHFKTKESIDRRYCIDFARPITIYPPEAKDTSRLIPPWDFEKIHTLYFPKDCGTGATGYLHNSDYFSYLIIDNSINKGTIILEDSKKNTTIEIPVDADLLTGFYDLKQNYYATSIVGLDGKSYFYPNADSAATDGKLVLAFGKLVLAIDSANKRLLGNIALTEPNYHIIETAFSLESKLGIPLVVVGSGWEGSTRLDAILDFSGNALKVIKLTDTSNSVNLLRVFKLQEVVWTNNGVEITIPKIQDITLPSSIDYDMLNEPENESLKQRKKQELENLFHNSKNYKDVFCDLNFGMMSPGCWGLVNEGRYVYQASGELQKK